MVPQNEVVYLCPGEELSVTCSTNNAYLEWTIQVSPFEYYSTGAISSSSPVDYYLWGRVGDTTVSYAKNSEIGVTPLISTLIINNVSAFFNGIVISCTGLDFSRISVTVIHVINGKIMNQ